MDFIALLLEFADKLKKGIVSFDVIPYGDILESIGCFYVKNGDYENKFVRIYGELLIEAMQKQNVNAIAKIFEMMAIDIEFQEINSVKYIIDENCCINYAKILNYYERNPQRNIVPFEGKGVIYSAVTGGYDTIRDPEVVNPDFDYILYTDNDNIKSNVWTVKKIDNPEELDSVRLARKVKIMGHEYLPGYDFSVWIDGKMQITGDITEYIEKYRHRETMICFSHYGNDCIYKELEQCVMLGKDNADIMRRQIERYREEGYPEENGMIDSCVLVRDLRSERCKHVMEVWWNEVRNGSRRDQLSFNYACWRENFMYDTGGLFCEDNKYFRLYPHN